MRQNEQAPLTRRQMKFKLLCYPDQGVILCPEPRERRYEQANDSCDIMYSIYSNMKTHSSISGQ